ncbi:GPP34 family phosphoprotein [Lentzea sp. NPDC059081]|uniref:GPP34 family phosphoprotein n=1 Tax=Lentzea sp. NPDC059081 TaxID=3346719 RepID=UPI0036B8FF25
MTFVVRPALPRGAAEQFYLSAHDHRGIPQLTGRALEFGAATALLGELVIQEYLAFSDEQTLLRRRAAQVLRSPVAPNRPTVVYRLLQQIAGSPKHTPGDWITHFAPKAPLWIARRMLAANVVSAATPPWVKFWDTTTRYMPRDPNAPYKLGDHLVLALQNRSRLTLQDLFLAGLLRATALHHTRIADLPHADELIATKVRALDRPAHLQNARRDRSLRVLLSHTEHLINTAVLAQTL